LDLQFSKFQIFNGRKGQESQLASRYQTSWRSVKPLLRYGNISIFHNGGRRHVGFFKFEIILRSDMSRGSNCVTKFCGDTKSLAECKTIENTLSLRWIFIVHNVALLLQP